MAGSPLEATERADRSAAVARAERSGRLVRVAGRGPGAGVFVRVRSAGSLVGREAEAEPPWGGRGSCPGVRPGREVGGPASPGLQPLSVCLAASVCL